MRLLPLAALLLVSCDQKAPTAEECKALAAPKAMLERCYGGTLGRSQRYVEDVKCWPFSKPQRLVGLWVVSLETSAFYPNAHTLDEVTRRPPRMWLESELLKTHPDLQASAQGANTRIYAVEFEGRQALCDGPFGHFGMYPREVVAERFYSMRLFQVLPNVP